jgi:photosystem II stability/assembly factor-like uncharacterized protein
MSNLYLGKQTIIKNNDWNFGGANVHGANTFSVDGTISSMPPDFETFGKNWIDVSLNARNYNSITTSSSGQYCSITVSGETIYNSTDYGSSWVQADNAPNANWVNIVSSANGVYRSACINNGTIMRSTDYGITWSSSDAPDSNWSKVAMSSSGQYQIACINNGTIYYSLNYGVNWVQSNSITDYWKSVSITSRGKLATAVSELHIYHSSDYGQTWTISSDDTATAAIDVVMSYDGLYQTIIGTTNVYYTDSSGATWNISQDLSGAIMNSIAMSATGEHQVIGLDNNNIYLSNDYGKTWAISDSISSYWTNVTMSSTGQYLYAISSNSSHNISLLKKSVLENQLIYSLAGVTGPTITGISIDYMTDVSLNYLTIHGGINIGGHILPTIDNTFDIGSAEYKIRDLYVSNNSIWVGDDHKIAVSDGKMKFIKRKLDVIPSGITGTTNTGITASIIDAQQYFIGIGQPKASIQDFKVHDWIKYTKARGLSNQTANNIFNVNTDFNDEPVSNNGTIQQWTP